MCPIFASHRGRCVTTSEERKTQAKRLADAHIKHKLPLSLNSLAVQTRRAERQQQDARIIANRFAVHAKTYGVMAETDPRWQVQPLWLQGQIKDFLKLSRKGADEFLEQLRLHPDRLNQLEAAVKVGLANVNALS